MLPLISQYSFSNSKELNVVSWGGAYTYSQIQAYHKPFTAKTGINIMPMDYIGGIAEIRRQVDSGEVTWDVIDLTTTQLVSSCREGLLETIDKSILPQAPDGTKATEDFIEGSLLECGIATNITSSIYAYDKTRYDSTPPTTIADFFDLKKYPGKRGMRSVPKVTMEFALMADGVPPKDVYRVLTTAEGIDRAFKKLDTIKDQIVWWRSGAEAPQLIADGKVVMATAWNGRIFNAIAEKKQPLQIVCDAHIYDISYWAIISGSKNKNAAVEFIKFSTDTQRLADLTKWIAYSPARKSSMQFVDKNADGTINMKPYMPTNPDNFKNAIRSDYEFWFLNGEELERRFNEWMKKP